jgi:2-C-methyl-D-erythritol 4-phosphate cytidylyltransferase/2-C-methyl-D-erythritol 2,4-cyclodiphosphate synthase
LKKNKVAAIIVAAGAGKRFGGDVHKQLVGLDGKPILQHTLEKFQACERIDTIILVAARSNIRHLRRMIFEEWGVDKLTDVIPGGKERYDSVWAGLSILPEDVDLVVIHDGVRPLVSDEKIVLTIEGAVKYGAAVLGLTPTDTIKQVSGSFAVKTPGRGSLVAVQTPQAFQKDLILRAYRKAFADKVFSTDDTALVERLDVKIHLVQGEPRNIKITLPQDLIMAEALLQSEKMCMTVGHGFDVHQLVSGRKLIIGGVDIPFEKGLSGHSDADVLCHAISDALLGASGLGDIGGHFPDSDPQYAGISSLLLLGKVMTMLENKGLWVGNIDATLVAQRPKFAPFIEEMRKNLAAAAKLPLGRISVKATTTEGLGYTGRGEGIAAHAVVLLTPSQH